MESFGYEFFPRLNQYALIIIALYEILNLEIKSNFRVIHFKLTQLDNFKQSILMKMKISSFCFERNFQKKKFEEKTLKRKRRMDKKLSHVVIQFF